jgi:replicative DNA helicase
MSNNRAITSLPHSIEAEKAVIGSVLLDPSQLALVIDKVRLAPKHFYDELHQRVFSTLISLEEKSIDFDGLLIAQKLAEGVSESEEEKISTYLALLHNGSIAQNVEYHAQVVKQRYYLRRIITACQKTIGKAQAFSSEGAATSVIEEIEQDFLSIANEQDTSDGLIQAKDVLHSTLEALEIRIQNEGEITGISSGFKDLDRITGGWQNSDLIIVAARPGMGKTALALNWALNAAKHKNASVAIFTLEMSRNQLMERLLSAEGRIDSTSLRKGSLSEEDQDRLMQAARLIHNDASKIRIDETPGITLSEIRSRCKRLKKEGALDIIIIDYLQLMSGSEIARKQGREREISEISIGLKGLAKELKVPIIAAAQLNRGPDSRPDKRPKISDLRESGSMEQDADQILFIYRDDYYNPNSELAGKAEIIIAKNRHGETASIHLAWLPNYVSFHNLIKD